MGGSLPKKLYNRKNGKPSKDPGSSKATKGKDSSAGLEKDLKKKKHWYTKEEKFKAGDKVLYGKYKNKKGTISGFGKDEKGNPTVKIKPIKKDTDQKQKKDQEIGLYKIWDLKETFFHGTTTQLNPGDEVLPPSITGRVSEKGRKKNLDKVFITKDLGSAKIYAGRAKNSLGGTPAVYEVEPEGDMEVINATPGTTVISVPRAKVIKKII